LAALVIYGTIYHDRTTSDIDLSQILRGLRLSAQDGELLTGVVDAMFALDSEPSQSGP
jgi:hypothetical protein